MLLLQAYSTNNAGGLIDLCDLLVGAVMTGCSGLGSGFGCSGQDQDLVVLVVYLVQVKAEVWLDTGMHQVEGVLHFGKGKQTHER